MDVTASQNQGCDERLRKRGKYTWLTSFRRPSRTYSSSSSNSLHLSGVLMSQGYSRGDTAGSGAAEKEAHRTSTEHTDQCGGDPICYLNHIIWQYGRLLCNGKRERAGLREKKNQRVRMNRLLEGSSAHWSFRFMKKLGGFARCSKVAASGCVGQPDWSAH